MAQPDSFIPELREWNNGTGIAPADWIWCVGRADHALGYSSFLWPDLSAFEAYVLRGPVDEARLRGWEAAGHSRTQIETAMNVFFLDGVFPNDPAAADLKERQLGRLAEVMVAMLSAKLKHEFPDRAFSAFIIDDDEDFGVSFHQC